jgi:sorting nexin-4
MAGEEEHDNFSNISWHSERNAGAQAASGAAAPPAHEPTTPDFESSRQEARRTRSPGPGETGEIIECTVSDPLKENDGTKDSYVSYLITTNVCLPLHRRFAVHP